MSQNTQCLGSVVPLAINTSYVCCACRYTNTMSHVYVPMGIGRRLERGHLQSQVRLRAATRYPWDGSQQNQFKMLSLKVIELAF